MGDYSPFVQGRSSELGSKRLPKTQNQRRVDRAFIR